MSKDIVRLLVEARDSARAELEQIQARYEGGGFYSNDDSSAEDYYDGQVVAYDHAIQLIELAREEAYADLAKAILKKGDV